MGDGQIESRTIAGDLSRLEPVRIGRLERWLIKLIGGDSDELERRSRVAVHHLTTGNFVSDTLTGTLTTPSKDGHP